MRKLWRRGRIRIKSFLSGTCTRGTFWSSAYRTAYAPYRAGWWLIFPSYTSWEKKWFNANKAIKSEHCDLCMILSRFLKRSTQGCKLSTHLKLESQKSIQPGNWCSSAKKWHHIRSYIFQPHTLSTQSFLMPRRILENKVCKIELQMPSSSLVDIFVAKVSRSSKMNQKSKVNTQRFPFCLCLDTDQNCRANTKWRLFLSIDQMNKEDKQLIQSMVEKFQKDMLRIRSQECKIQMHMAVKSRHRSPDWKIWG